MAQADLIGESALEPRVARWLARQMIADAPARLVDAGAGIDHRIMLTEVFVDLPLAGEGLPAKTALASLCGGAATEESRCARWLLVGGAGSGKSTLSTMVAQVLRRPWVQAARGVLPEAEAEAALAVCAAVDALTRKVVPAATPAWLPLRVDLPTLASWMASAGEHDALPGFLAAQMAAGEDEAITEEEVRRAVLDRRDLFWIFDGLDEVPSTSNRDALVRGVREALAATGGRVLVTTRPQGYAGEFDDLAGQQLVPLDLAVATTYAEKLLVAWLGPGPLLEERRKNLQREFWSPQVQELVQSPLHVTMAALLVAEDGKLPESRWKLLDSYVRQIFKRELRKDIANGIRAEDEGRLRVLHARAGLVLQMRGALAGGARPLLRPHELRRMVEEKLREDGHSNEEAQEVADRLLRFADERLVLLLRQTAMGYGFAVRSLQEFFAAEALFEDPDRMAERVRAIALDPYWLNVVLLIASRGAHAASPHEQRRAIEYAARVCNAIDSGVSGAPAAAARLGARLALAMHQETQNYAWPAFHEALWEVVIHGIEGPLQQTQRVGYEVQERWRLSPTAVRVWSDDTSLQQRAGQVLASWDGSGCARWRRRARETVERMLNAGSDLRRAGVEVLAGLLEHDDAEVLATFRAQMPWPEEEAKDLVWLLWGARPRDAPSAVRELVTAMPRLFPLGSLIRQGYRLDRADARVDAINAAAAMGRLREREVERRIEGTRLSLRLRPLNEEAQPEWGEVERFALTQADPIWEAWASVARFHIAPSVGSLADALDAIARADALDDVLLGNRVFSWPLAACLVTGLSSAELKGLASRVRTGELGDRPAWHAAQERWSHAQPIGLDSFLSALQGSVPPWSIASEDLGLIPACVGFTTHYGMHDEGEADDLIREAVLDALRSRPQPWVALRTFDELVAGWRQSGEWLSAVPLECVDADRVIGIRDPASILRCLDAVLPDGSSADAADWIRALDEWGRRGEIYTQGVYASRRHRVKARLIALATALMPRAGESHGLLVAILFVLHSFPTLDLSALRLPSSLGTLTPRLRAVAGVYDLLVSPLVGDLFARLALMRGSDERGSFTLIPAVAQILAEREPTTEPLEALYAAAPDDAARAVLASAMHAQLRRSARPSFASAEEWADFGFPGTFPGRQPPEPTPLRVLSINEVSNLRVFREGPRFAHPLPTPSAGAGQWIVLLGENGVGKTTLLRAVALALAPSAVGTKLLDDRLPMVRNGDAASIRLTLDSGAYAARVERAGAEPTERVVSDDQRDRPWVVGYGVRRGNARGESDRDPEPGPFGALHTLFERPGSLYNAASWLLDLRRRVLEEEAPRTPDERQRSPGPESRTWSAVTRALLRVLPHVTEVEPGRDHVFVRHAQFGRVRLDALSDGYLTTVGWVVDLVARWVERQRALGEPVGDLLREMVGLVLLDEIDLHLHPVWQMRVIEDVRALFPRLSFVVTTHNPLALQGARRGEIFVMRHAETGGVEVVQHDVMPGYDVDRVLLEQFGVYQTFDRETRKLLDEYRVLREAGAEPEHPRRRELEVELEVRLGTVGRRVAETLRGASEEPRRFTPEQAASVLADRRARRKGAPQGGG